MNILTATYSASTSHGPFLDVERTASYVHAVVRLGNPDLPGRSFVLELETLQSTPFAPEAVAKVATIFEALNFRKGSPEEIEALYAELRRFAS